jgi:hypothetical protein
MTLAEIAGIAEGRDSFEHSGKTLDVESPALLSGLGDLRERISSPHGLSG